VCPSAISYFEAKSTAGRTSHNVTKTPAGDEFALKSFHDHRNFSAPPQFLSVENWREDNLSRVTESDERVLIEAAQQDPGRFAELYERNFHVVYAYIARRIHDRSEAQDLTAYVFQQALANIGKFKWRGAPFVAWLYRIAANAIADQNRRKSRETTETEVVSNTAVDPDLEQVERRAQLFRAVDELPEDQRKVILLRFGEEKSIREIAVRLNRSEGAVKQLQFRGLENLRARLRE